MRIVLGRAHLTALAITATTLLMLTTFGCERARPSRVHSERIGSIGRDYRKRSLAVSFDHRRLAWVQGRGADCRVVVDGKPGPLFKRCGDPRFSPDGKTVAYWAAIEVDPPQVQLVVDGAAQPVTALDQGTFVFSRRGAHWAAIAPTGSGDPAAAGPADPALDGAPAPAPSPIPRRLTAFDAKRVLGEYRDTSTLAVSPDGAHVAFIASDASGTQTLVVDGEVVRSFGLPEVPFMPALKQTKPGPALEPEVTVQYLTDGSLAGVALGRQGWTVFHDQEDWATYPGLRMPPDAGFEVTQSELIKSAAIYAGSVVAAESAPVACWWEKTVSDPEKWRVSCNGKAVDDILCDAPLPAPPITVSPDGRAVLYVCQITPPTVGGATPSDPRNLWVVSGGKKDGPHRFVWGLGLSEDGRHLAFAAADSIEDPWFYVVDGKRYDGRWMSTFPPKLAKDGSSVVWGASREEDGKRVELVKDGKVRTRAEMVMAPPIFRDDGAVQWAVKRGNSVRRIIID